MQRIVLDEMENSTIESVHRKDFPWLIKLFLALMLVPSEYSFYLGSFRFTLYRVFLLLFFLPCLLRIFQDKKKRILPSDKLLLAFSFFMIFALAVNHDFLFGLKSGGILMVESFGAYMLARSYIINEWRFNAFVKFYMVMVIGLSIITIPESITGKNILRPYIGHIGDRFGFERAFGVFDHPILYGVFCAALVPLAWYAPNRNFLGAISTKLATIWTIIATLASVSSGALSAMMVQSILAVWGRMTRSIKSRWTLFTLLFMVCYIIVDLISNRSPMLAIVTRLTFNADTAYHRFIIWEWGTKFNVAEHPWLGIGFNEWVRPAWMVSGSMDNFWLVNMVQFGLPAFFLLAAGILKLLFTVKKNESLSESASLIRTGWGISMVSLIIAGCTVHFWNHLYVWFFFLLGSGGWMAYSTEELANHKDK